MVRRLLHVALAVSLTLSLPLAECWGRGFGGGGFGGGGFGGFGGGGFGGGAGHSLGGFGGGQFGGAGLGGRVGSGLPGGLGSAGAGGGRMGSGAAFGGLGGVMGAGRVGSRGFGSQGVRGDRFSSPSDSQLSNFLGLPSDGGLHDLGASTRSTANQLPAGGHFDVNYGTAEGPRGGQAAGVSVLGLQGNTMGRVIGAGSQAGVGTIAGVQGADRGVAARGIAVAPGGQATAVGAVRGPAGYGAARGVAVGPGGAAAGFARVTPSGRYTTAAAVRTNYSHWGIYGRSWYAQYPGAWFPPAWATGAAWRPCTWGTVASYCGYYETPPVYYDYGNNVTYQDNSVYLNGEEVGTAEQYYSQASTIATAGTQADAPADGDWLPLGVFALTRPDQTKSDVTIQLAINKQGVIRGNYTDTVTNKNQLIQGSLDKESQRVAFTVGDNSTNFVETGLYNLTKDEAPCLIHFGSERTEQWLLVRLQKPDNAGN
jgi:hypothetical protein